jgi:hypothetical protein
VKAVLSSAAVCIVVLVLGLAVHAVSWSTDAVQRRRRPSAAIDQRPSGGTAFVIMAACLSVLLTVGAGPLVG